MHRPAYLLACSSPVFPQTYSLLSFCGQLVDVAVDLVRIRSAVERMSRIAAKKPPAIPEISSGSWPLVPRRGKAKQHSTTTVSREIGQWSRASVLRLDHGIPLRLRQRRVGPH